MSPNRLLALLFALLSLLTCERAVRGQTRTGSAAAKSIVGKMAAQYARATSYQDTGEVTGMSRGALGPVMTVIKFRTHFARPHSLLFEWTERDIRAGEERLSAVWNDGKQTFSYSPWKNPSVEKEETLGLGIAGATGVSHGSAHTITALLMEDVSGFRLTQMTGLSVLGEEKFEGEDCHVVRGYHPFDFPIDMWIGKRDFLLRKTRQVNKDGSQSVEVRRDVKLDAKIPPETFRFKPPSGKDKKRPRGMA